MAAKVQTRFFHEIEKVRCFVDMKVPTRVKEKNGFRQEQCLLFRMTLDGNLVRSAPDFVKAAYDGLKENAESLVKLKKEITGVQVVIYELPNKRQKPILQLDDCRISDLAVKEIKSGKNDVSIVLTFSVVLTWDSDVWRFLGRHYKTEVFLEFDSSQASLLDLEDEEDTDQPDLPGVVENETEEAEAAEETASAEG